MSDFHEILEEIKKTETHHALAFGTLSDEERRVFLENGLVTWQDLQHARHQKFEGRVHAALEKYFRNLQSQNNIKVFIGDREAP